MLPPKQCHSLENKRDLQALCLSWTSKRPPSCATPRQPIIYTNSIVTQEFCVSNILKSEQEFLSAMFGVYAFMVSHRKNAFGSVYVVFLKLHILANLQTFKTYFIQSTFITCLWTLLSEKR